METHVSPKIHAQRILENRPNGVTGQLVANRADQENSAETDFVKAQVRALTRPFYSKLATVQGLKHAPTGRNGQSGRTAQSRAETAIEGEIENVQETIVKVKIHRLNPVKKQIVETRVGREKLAIVMATIIRVTPQC